MKNDNAVSPVIATILLVSIVVILAAVVASFVLGIAGEQKVSHTAGFTVDRVPNGMIGVVYSNNGGDDVAMTSVDIYVGDTLNTYASPTVGQQWSYPYPSGTNRVRVHVVCHYPDGTDFPALDKYL